MNYESLKQKCVDGELSNEEREQLLDWLEQNPSEWKDLACCYMEDQLFGQAVVSEPVPVRSSVRPVPQPPKNSRWRLWFAHPVTSVALCLCVAFLSGMLIRDNSSPSMAGGESSVPYRLTSTKSEFPRAMSSMLSSLGYNQAEPSKRMRPVSSTYVDGQGRRFLKLTTREGQSMYMPFDQIHFGRP